MIKQRLWLAKFFSCNRTFSDSLEGFWFQKLPLSQVKDSIEEYAVQEEDVDATENYWKKGNG